MRLDVTGVVEKLLATNRNSAVPEPGPPEYGVTGLLEGDLLELTLTFLEGRAYCCMEWGCHLALRDGARWTRWREALQAAGIEPPPRSRMRLIVIVEWGALYSDFLNAKPDIPIGTPGRYRLTASYSQRYKVLTQEAIE